MRKEFMYDFEDGGFNTQFAETEEEAYELACERWADSPSLTPDRDTFRSVDENKEIYENKLSMFW